MNREMESLLGLYLKQRQRLEELFFDFAFHRFRDADNKRLSPLTSCEHIHNQSGFTIFQGMEHNGLRFRQHTLQR